MTSVVTNKVMKVHRQGLNSRHTFFIEDRIGTLKRRKNHSEGSTGVPGPSLLDQRSEQQFHGVIYDELDYYMTRLQEEIGLF